MDRLSHDLLLRLEGICKRFGSRQLFNELALELHQQQYLLLSGPNGVGKSTLLRIIAGLEKPGDGQFDTGCGARHWKTERRRLLEMSIYLHQQPYMFDASVARNIAYALPQGLDKATRHHKVAQALSWAGLEPLAKTCAITLSGGERQRVALARAWVSCSPLLLLDEPTANMDTQARSRTLELLCQLKDEGRSLIIASHDPAHFNGLVDDVALLLNGRIHMLGSMENQTNIRQFTPRASA
ncbi:MAG TPA: ATP-binding cassette domain-containing protein [Chromatiales bacterium]|nr:ATP-binding cassette domain-containing protein [Chromatiales bacterium]